jgi:hypothetical protein
VKYNQGTYHLKAPVNAQQVMERDRMILGIPFPLQENLHAIA